MNTRRFALSAISFAALCTLGAQPAPAAVNPVTFCGFSPVTFAFEGAPLDQARCLLRPITRRGEQGPELAALPATLTAHIGQPFDLDRAALQRVFGTDSALSALLASDGISHGGGDLQLPARYFVIHDTSTPPFGAADFPQDLNDNTYVNSFRPYQKLDPPGHAFINRLGDVFVGHDFSEPLRETKLENWNIGGVIGARGLFIHIELVQPRRDDPTLSSTNGAIAPDPGFTPAQYRRLAQLYIIASARAGTWLVPGFHANIDRWFNDAHDDPQNFSLTDFDAALGTMIAAVRAG